MHDEDDYVNIAELRDHPEDLEEEQDDVCEYMFLLLLLVFFF
jgi:hypothetical protein